MQNYFFKITKLSSPHPFITPLELQKYDNILNLQHKYLFHDKFSIFTYNKKNSEITEIGRVESEILHLSCSNCQKYYVCVTKDVILLFNYEFEIIGEVGMHNLDFDNSDLNMEGVNESLLNRIENISVGLTENIMKNNNTDDKNSSVSKISLSMVKESKFGENISNDILNLPEKIDVNISANEMEKQKINLNIGNIYVCWGDDQLLISFDTIRIYDFKLQLLYEGYNNSPIAYRHGYHVYCIYNEGKLTFIEENGLVLEILDYVDIIGKIIDLKFINDNLLTGIIEKNDKSYLFILSGSNNHWYLKNMAEIVCEFRIHSTTNNGVFLKNKDVIWMYYIEEYRVECNLIQAIIDGCMVKITDFSKGLVPLPFEHLKIECHEQVNCVTINMDYTCIMLLSEIIIMKNNKMLFKIKKDDLYKFLIAYSKKGRTFLDLLADRKYLCLKYIELIKTRLYIILGFYVLEYSLDNRCIDNVTYHKNINKIYNWNNIVWFRDEDTLTDGKSKINVCINQSLSLYNHDSLMILLVDDKLKVISKQGTAQIEQVISCKIHNDYLLFIKKQKLVTFCLKTKIYQLYSIHEKGSKIIEVLDSKIIFITRRGNLEIFESRFLVKQKIIELIKIGKYQEAIQSAKENCIILSIFANKDFSFANLIKDLSDMNLLVNFVVHIYEEFDSKYDKQVNYQISLYDMLNNIKYDKDSFVLYEKIDYVFNCEINTKDKFINFVMNNMKSDCNEIKVKIYTRLMLLEDAMFYIMKDFKLLAYAKKLSQVEKIIQAALGTYNLEFTKKVILSLNKDSYLGFIENITSFELIDQIIAINKTLNRCDKVVFYLSQKNQEEEKKYIQSNKMYNILKYMKKFYSNEHYDCQYLPFLSRFDRVIHRVERVSSFYDALQADYLYETDKKACIPYYIEAGLHQKAFTTAIELKDWICACSLNQNINSKENYALIIQCLLNEHEYAEIGHIYQIYLKDNENAYNFYLKAHHYKKAQELFATKFSNELSEIIKTSKETIQESIKNVEILINRFNSIIKTKSENNDMLTSSTMTTKSKKNVLRDKKGSRYEKEYVLNQVRLAVNKIMLVRDGMKEVGIDYKFDFSVQWSEVEKIFDYAKSVYDGTGPFIDKPEWSE